MGKPLNNLQDFQFGSLTVLQLGKSHGNGAVWLCQCKCGTQKEIRASDMVQGSVKSCGCEHIKRIAKASTTHGMTNTRTYSIWQAMRLRCNRINQDYSCRGITYDECWDSFENFYLDMGEVPTGMSIDRIDVNGNYNKDNCRWATQEQQANNKRSSVFIEYNGKKQTVSQWAKELKMNHHTLRSRLKKGLTAEQALTPLPAESN
jgi:hypothetical protein